MEPQHQPHSQHEQPIADQLSCSVCMCLFKHPVTIQCGHTFCRSCLLNYTRTKRACPICRTVLTHVTEYPMQDWTIGMVVDFVRAGLRKGREGRQGDKGMDKGEDKGMRLEHYEDLLLVDIRCRQLLLPYTKVSATFQLQSPTLLPKLQHFVARQEHPYNQLGIISKITYINQLRYNVYECTIEGKAFCHIENQAIERRDQQGQEYFYRVCQARVVYEDEEDGEGEGEGDGGGWRQGVDGFLARLMEIRDQNILKEVYKIIDPQKLFSKTNPTATFYSILRILACPSQQKYKLALQFSPKQRQQYLLTFLAQLPDNIAKNPHKLIAVKTGDSFRRQLLAGLGVFIVVCLVMLMAWSGDDAEL